MVRESPRVGVVRAPNPGPMTLDGTNSYVLFVAPGTAVVIDPGPAIEAHVDALVRAVADAGARLDAILVTHGHLDHAPGAPLLARRTGAPVLAHPAAQFPHDRALGDREQLAYPDATLEAIDAPGHSFDHLVYYLHEERALFTGDVILGRGTTVIAPPGGAMRPYLATLERLRTEYGDAARIYGGHGPPIDDPAGKLREYVEHRRGRERQIVAELERGPATIPELVARIYPDLDGRLRKAAAAQLRAHLDALETDGRVAGEPPLESDARRYALR